MRVRSLGIKKVHNVPMLGVHLSFVHPALLKSLPPVASNGTQYVQPTEFRIQLGDGQYITPAYVHSSRAEKKDQSTIVLSGVAHEVVELLYPLPKENGDEVSIPVYLFQWKVHYGQDKSEQQIVRFDRYDATPEQGAEPFPEDNDYPYDISPMEMPGWTIVRGPYWWPLYPGW